MFKIVLTGGPCGGKSTSMAKLESTLNARGYKVLILPETATELILNGIHPSENISMDRFQDFVLSKQISKEKLYDEVAKQFDTDKLVILYDRGIGDQLAYISTDALKEKINKHKIDLNNAVNRYDLVLHLTTAADGTDAYEWKGSETCGNMARSESPEEAIQKDRLTLNGWINAGCEHVKVIDNSTDFDGKISRILEEVFSLLGEPTPCEIERKYLIKKPSLEVLNKLNSCSKSNII